MKVTTVYNQALRRCYEAMRQMDRAEDAESERQWAEVAQMAAHVASTLEYIARDEHAGQGTIRLRLCPEDVEAFEEGIDCDVVRLALGVDGVYEIELIGADPDALPEHSAKPPVPLVEAHR